VRKRLKLHPRKDLEGSRGLNRRKEIENRKGGGSGLVYNFTSVPMRNSYGVKNSITE